MSGSAGYVYVAQFADGLVKVGFTKKPPDRLQQVSRQSGRASCHHWVSDRLIAAYQLEAATHSALESFRVQGEWYLCDFQHAVDVTSSLQAPFERWSQSWQDAVDSVARRRGEALIATVAGAQCKAAIENAVRKLLVPLKLKMIRDDIAADAIGRLLRRGVKDPFVLFLAVLNDRRIQHISDAGLIAAGAAGEILDRAARLSGENKIEEMLQLVHLEVERRVDAEDPLDIECLDALAPTD